MQLPSHRFKANKKANESLFRHGEDNIAMESEMEQGVNLNDNIEVESEVVEDMNKHSVNFKRTVADTLFEFSPDTMEPAIQKKPRSDAGYFSDTESQVDDCNLSDPGSVQKLTVELEALMKITNNTTYDQLVEDEKEYNELKDYVVLLKFNKPVRRAKQPTPFNTEVIDEGTYMNFKADESKITAKEKETFIKEGYKVLEHSIAFNVTSDTDFKQSLSQPTEDEALECDETSDDSSAGKQEKEKEGKKKKQKTKKAPFRLEVAGYCLTMVLKKPTKSVADGYFKYIPSFRDEEDFITHKNCYVQTKVGELRQLKKQNKDFVAVDCEVLNSSDPKPPKIPAYIFKVIEDLEEAKHENSFAGSYCQRHKQGNECRGCFKLGLLKLIVKYIETYIFTPRWKVTQNSYGEEDQVHNRRKCLVIGGLRNTGKSYFFTNHVFGDDRRRVVVSKHRFGRELLKVDMDLLIASILDDVNIDKMDETEFKAWSAGDPTNLDIKNHTVQWPGGIVPIILFNDLDKFLKLYNDENYKSLFYFCWAENEWLGHPDEEKNFAVQDRTKTAGEVMPERVRNYNRNEFIPNMKKKDKQRAYTDEEHVHYNYPEAPPERFKWDLNEIKAQLYEKMFKEPGKYTISQFLHFYFSTKVNQQAAGGLVNPTSELFKKLVSDFVQYVVAVFKVDQQSVTVETLTQYYREELLKIIN